MVYGGGEAFEQIIIKGYNEGSMEHRRPET